MFSSLRERARTSLDLDSADHSLSWPSFPPPALRQVHAHLAFPAQERYLTIASILSVYLSHSLTRYSLTIHSLPPSLIHLPYFPL